MCGIAGYFSLNKNSNFSDKTLEKMISSISHRGPDSVGYFNNNQVGFGVARLSIIDVEKGNQPLFNETKRIIIVGNGEIYNSAALRTELIQDNHFLSCGSDIETVVHLYEKYGENSFERLRGMYGLAIFDSEHNLGYLVRDPAGIKPLYYSMQGSSIYFSSEIKSILTVCNSVNPNLSQLKRSLAYRSSDNTETCFDGIYKVPRSSYVKIMDGKIQILKYEPFFEDNKISIDQALILSISRELMSDVPIGSFLSGGLDSSLISAMMKKMLGLDYKFHTFSVGYGIQGDEYAKSRVVANHIGSIHHEVKVETSDILLDLDRIVWHMDEPTLNPAVVPLFYLAREAKKHVKVVLVGDGADEVFAGYDKYVELLQTWDTNRLNPMLFFERRMPFDFTILRKYGINPDLSFFDTWNIFLLSAKTREDYLRNAMAIDREQMLPNLQLMTVDRATMAQGIEARVPFLHQDILKSVENYGVEKLIVENTGKMPLRQFAQSYLPNTISHGKKEIFFVPTDYWMDQGMGSLYFTRVERSKIIPEILDINRLVEEHVNLTSYQKWCLLVIDSWFNNFF